MADYITTYTKIHFTPLNPRPEDIKIEDIAHALSLMTRANGHFPEFYSVAQHCIACAEEAAARGYSKNVVLACLLHDAQEAYMADVTRPVKKHLEKFIEIESQLQNAIYRRFGLTLTDCERALVDEIDDAMLYYEFLHYMGEHLADVPPKIASQPVFVTKPFKDMEKRYIEMYEKLNVGFC